MIISPLSTLGGRLTMNIIENVKSGVSAAMESISDATQNLIEKNRINAKVNRLNLVIKNETLIINKAYARLGKYYFDSTSGSGELDSEKVNSLFEIIRNSKARLSMAQDILRSMIEIRSAETRDEPSGGEGFVDELTIACSTEKPADSKQESAEEAPEELPAEEAPAENITETDASEEAADDSLDVF